MNIAIVCVPFQNDIKRWGVAQGAQAFLDAGLIDRLRAAGHTVREPAWVDLPREQRTRDTVTNLGRIAAGTSDAVFDALRDNDRVIVLEGDCTHSVGAAGGLARAAGGAGIVWFDAHGDMHTLQTTSTGLLGGMPFAVSMGWEFDDWREAAGLRAPVRCEAAALVGASDLDPEEEHALRTHPIARLDAVDMMDDQAGPRLAALLAPRAGEAPAWYLHLDLDVAGPVEVPGGLTPAPHFPPRQALLDAARATTSTLAVRVISLAAYNPGTDTERRGARFGVDMALAAVGG